MSERYGAPDELYEVLADLEAYARKEIATSKQVIKMTQDASVAKLEAGRWEAMRDVLTYLDVDGK